MRAAAPALALLLAACAAAPQAPTPLTRLPAGSRLEVLRPLELAPDRPLRLQQGRLRGAWFDRTVWLPFCTLAPRARAPAPVRLRPGERLRVEGTRAWVEAFAGPGTVPVHAVLALADERGGRYSLHCRAWSGSLMEARPLSVADLRGALGGHLRLLPPQAP
ncbi:hypothetical protein [Inmirania thermothiophila]|uniref:Lipoprotein n=1 Tax=Inmirania thermothiophila TaxID=1750597 RepID=A0A3N1Y645_9GAMM|nr:hypothetical protein [Inmirania thermothiophila]ROR32787.1 hypothetical protein EDC57_1999 [Inmirania thermothiophila]